MPKTQPNKADPILPLYLNGLNGRLLKLPPPKGKSREILLIAGQHTSLERILGLAKYLNRYGSVTSPDLPGFGGMDSFYRIGGKPELDAMADYLATFIKWRYKRKRLTIIAVSYGFSVVTRMLQRYPDITNKVDLVVSISGLVNHRDFRWKRHNIFLLHSASKICSRRLPAFFATNIFIRKPVIKSFYRIAERMHPKLKDANPEEKDKRVDFEINLWKANDFRTWAATSVTMFNLELGDKRVDLPIYHVAINDDHYFNNVSVEQHMRQIYNDFSLIKTKLPAHAPTVLATTKDVEPFVPPAIRQLLQGKKIN